MEEKIRKLIVSFIISILLVNIFVGIPVMAEGITNEESDDYLGFEYPIRPGMDVWTQLNHGVRVLVLQIPTDILKNIETEELVQVVLDYPCFVDMIFYNSYQEDFYKIKSLNSPTVVRQKENYLYNYSEKRVDGEVIYEVDGKEYKYLVSVSGRSNNAIHDTQYTVLTNNEDITFDEVDNRVFGSDTTSWADCLVIEINLIDE